MSTILGTLRSRRQRRRLKRHDCSAAWSHFGWMSSEGDATIKFARNVNNRLCNVSPDHFLAVKCHSDLTNAFRYQSTKLP